MTKYEIEKGIPIPPHSNNRLSRPKIVAQMEIGDSLLLNTSGGIFGDAMKCGIKIVSRKEGKKVRIWRVK